MATVVERSVDKLAAVHDLTNGWSVTEAGTDATKVTMIARFDSRGLAPLVEAVRLLLRDVFRAAGGTHDDWDDYDRAMADEPLICDECRVFGR